MGLRTMKMTNARNRAALDPSVTLRSVSAVITEVDATAANTIRLTFNGRVLPGRLPLFTAGAGGAETVQSMSQVSETVVELVFTGSVQGTDLTVGDGDLGIRTPAGGFVPAGVYAIPTFP